jgi:hypothetical protein
LYFHRSFKPHQENNEEAKFRNIATSTGNTITLTQEHLILAGDCAAAVEKVQVTEVEKSGLSLQQAQNVKVNQCIVGKKGIEVVISNTEKIDYGLYTIITQEEYVVINNIVASPFAVNHYVVNNFYNVHRLFYSVFPASLVVHTKILELATFIADKVALFSVTFSIV